MSQPPKVTKTGPLGAFDPKLFSQAIQGLGLRFRWSRAVECPCRMDNSDQFNPTCANCGGDGWWYITPEFGRDRHDAADFVEVQCAFGQATIRDVIVNTFGEFSFTDALMTMQTEMRVSYRDRFIALEQEMSWAELLRSAGPGTTISVGKIGRTTDAQTRAMRYEPLKVNFLASETVPGSPVYYYEGQHYRLLESEGTNPQRIQWLPGQGPVLDTIFTVHYNCRPVWIVDDATYGIQALQGPEISMKGRFAARNLPTTFKVKLDFLCHARGA